MTIRGRAKLSPEVSVCVLTHIFGEFGLQEVAMLVDDTFANHLRAFRLGDLVARSEGKEKMTSGKSNGASGWRTARLGGAIYINDSAEQQDCRDSVGF
jgi:hypothetical protein